MVVTKLWHMHNTIRWQVKYYGFIYMEMMTSRMNATVLNRDQLLLNHNFTQRLFHFGTIKFLYVSFWTLFKISRHHWALHTLIWSDLWYLSLVYGLVKGGATSDLLHVTCSFELRDSLVRGYGLLTEVVVLYLPLNLMVPTPPSCSSPCQWWWWRQVYGARRFRVSRSRFRLIFNSPMA